MSTEEYDAYIIEHQKAMFRALGIPKEFMTEKDYFMMEKLGIDKQQLLNELRGKYTELKEKQLHLDPMQKEASASIKHELEMVQSKIDELTNDLP